MSFNVKALYDGAAVFKRQQPPVEHDPSWLRRCINEFAHDATVRLDSSCNDPQRLAFVARYVRVPGI